jgi:hypothetical protein
VAVGNGRRTWCCSPELAGGRTARELWINDGRGRHFSFSHVASNQNWGSTSCSREPVQNRRRRCGSAPAGQRVQAVVPPTRLHLRTGKQECRGPGAPDLHGPEQPPTSLHLKLLGQYWKGYCALVALSGALIFLRELHDLGRALTTGEYSQWIIGRITLAVWPHPNDWDLEKCSCVGFRFNP